jgi:uncharacterized protein YjiS (DUF1127 family)
MYPPLRDNIMNEALNISPSSDLDAASLSTFRRVRGDTTAANADDCVHLQAVGSIAAWARHASGANGFGDAMVVLPPASPRPTARELDRLARFARAQAVAEIVAAVRASIGAALRRAWANYRTYRAARETVRALRGLDDRSLHDLGYHRSEIDSVAMEISVARAR